MSQFQLGQSSLIINIETLNFWVLVILLVLLVIYSIYALVVLNQVRILNKSIHTNGAPLLNGLAFVHLIASLVLVLFGILFLLL